MKNRELIQRVEAEGTNLEEERISAMVKLKSGDVVFGDVSPNAMSLLVVSVLSG